MKIGFIGLGQMGAGMARRLVASGHSLTVWNRTPAAASPFRAFGARLAADPAQALAGEVVISMLADDTALEAVWLAPGLVAQVPPGVIHLNMASVSHAMGRRLATAHAAAGVGYVSAPVFGRPEVAESGQLDIVAGGAPEAIARCVPLFEVLGRRWFDVGADASHANLVKVARNFLLGSIIESLGEAFALLAKSGVEPAAFLDIITSTSMNAPAFRNYGRLMVEPPAQVTFPLKLGLKDVELALAAAADAGVDLPTARLMQDQHRAAIAAGYGARDWAALGNFLIDRATAR